MADVPWLECTGQKVIHNALAGANGFGGCFDLAVRDSFELIAVMEIVVYEDRKGHIKNIVDPLPLAASSGSSSRLLANTSRPRQA